MILDITAAILLAAIVIGVFAAGLWSIEKGEMPDGEQRIGMGCLAVFLLAILAFIGWRLFHWF